MKILVTGATGFIGSEVVKSLALAGHVPVALVRKAGVQVENASFTAVGDLTDTKTFERIENDLDAIVNCAGLAHQPRNTKESIFEAGNVETARNIAEFCVFSNIKRFLHISSVSVYGQTDYRRGAVDETAPCQPVGPYAVSKLRSESVCFETFENSDSILTIFRPSTVVGIGDPGNIRKLIERVNKGKFLPLGSGKNKKSFVDVRDLADAVVAALETDCEQTIYNVTAEAIAVKKLLRSICRGLGKSEPHLWIPGFAVNRPTRIVNRIAGNSPVGGFAGAIQKWLSEDVFSGERLKEFYSIKHSAPDSIEREAAWIAGK